MNNYVYIIASLPVISTKQKYSEDFDSGKILERIREQCSEKDRQTIDFLMDGFDDGKLGKEFYEKALSHRNGFLKEYFRFDLNLRNAKVNYLNQALGRPEGQDVMDIDGAIFEEAAKVKEVLHRQDILSRERGLDDLTWEKISGMTLFNYFDLTVILAFIAKLHIIDRWLKLDEKSGREMFRKLVDEVRGTFKGVEFNA